MNTRQQVRAIEKHVRSLSSSRAMQLATISKAQGMVLRDDHNLGILILVKRRIYRG